ncbi:hypothetical protein FA95DRAFT_1611310 [Auriscalpium vulgare]|uniref:Uncharacterized protein n=1 Tax=Auriscalpium vulgare TaxID=40419 RepID=A0ACB8RBT3_9AGAM|nr:hypothetical protein FA95DRAFT_1611310 [Auriscalpium vulgare]
MDDVWGNAWGEPTHTALPAPTWSSKLDPRPQEPPEEEEDDLAMPSWSTGAGINWDEPSNQPPALWSSQADNSEPWSPTSRYADISRHHSQSSEPSEPSSPVETPPHYSPPPISPSLPPSPPPPPEVDDHTPEPELAEAGAEPSPPASPDGFGTFEVGLPQHDADDDPWTATPSNFGAQDSLPGDEWGSGWSVQKEELVEEEHEDEWEAARRIKERMDRRVPPELLAGILAQVEELSKTAWPEPETSEDEFQWQRRWQTGMDSVENLDALRTRYIPDLTLPQLTPFGKSFTGKALANAVKLSRNSTVARNSPLANFLASKGSTAWETAVKSRVEVVTDDIPTGWRILEKEKEEKVEEKAKKSGGLLASLWGRRASGSVKVSSPVQETSTPTPTKEEPPARTSIDSVKSAASAPPLASTTHSRSPSIVPPISASPAPTLASTQSTTTTATSSYSDTGLPTFEPISREKTPPITPAPSAVSRFLGRFSRPRSSARNSLALSSDDLEFLGEVDVQGDHLRQESSTDEWGFDKFNAPPAKRVESKLPPILPPPPGASARQTHQAGGLFMSFDEPIAGPSSVSSLDRSEAPLSMSSRPTSRPARHGRENSHSSIASMMSTPAEDDLISGFSSVPAPASTTPSTTPSLFPDFDDLVLGSASAAAPVSLSMRPAATRQPPALSPPPGSKPTSYTLSPPPSASPRPGLISPPGSSLSHTTSSSRAQSPGYFRTASPIPPPLSRPLSLSPPLFPPSLPAPNMSTPKVSVTTTIPDNDDGFSDFLSSASPQLPPSASFMNTAFPSTDILPPAFKPSHAPITSVFDDFSDFVSSAPAQTPDSALLPPVQVISPSPAKTLLQRRRSDRSANDEHTLSLMSRAAARPGRWPAPPSPLPEALPPPPPSQPENFVNDLFGTPTDAQFSAVAPSVSSPAVFGQQPAAPKSMVDKVRGHQKTLSLLETAAARPGRWPAPPSPLPEALPPPPPPAGGVSTAADLLDASTPVDFGSKFSLQQSASSPAVLGLFGASTRPQSTTQTPSPMPMLPPPGHTPLLPPPRAAPLLRPPGAAVAPTPLLPPPGGALSRPTPQARGYSPDSTPLALLVGGNAAGGGVAKARTPLPPPVSTQGQRGAGGLSAQDLSFFEGL